jgi:glycosyltransferase involved in cell wall biosynthesis
MKKQIAFISEHASPLASLGGVDSGGQNVYVAETAKQLARMGFEVDIFTRSESPHAPRIVRWFPGVRVIHVKAGREAVVPKEQLMHHMPQFRDGMLDFMLTHRKKYQLIHAHFFMSAMVAADIKKILDIPFVVTFHALGMIRRIYQGKNDGFPASRIDAEKSVVREADYIIAECPQDEADLIEHYDADADKIITIPCGFNTEEFYPISRCTARSILRIPKDEKILLQLGRMVPRKGVDNVIRAVSLLKKQGCHCKLVVVGGESEVAEDHPEMRRLRRIAEEGDVADSVIFTGRKDRYALKYFYSAADIFVTTPWYEPFGITPLEAMACGTPVIGANVGGIKFSVADGETGFLVPPADAGALAEKISLLLENEALRSEMKQNGFRRVNKLFTWKSVCEQLNDLYQHVIESVYTMKSVDFKFGKAV